MNHFMSKKTIQKIMAIFVILILSNFIMGCKATFADDKDDATTWLENYANTVALSYKRPASNLYDAFVQAEGVKSVKVEDNKLVVTIKAGYSESEVKANIQNKLIGVVYEEANAQLLAQTQTTYKATENNSNNSNNNNNTSNSGNNSNAQKSDEEKFKEALRNKNYNLTSDQINRAWEDYNSGLDGANGKAVTWNSATGEITLNYTQDQRVARGISNQATSEIHDDQSQNDDEGDIDGGLLLSPISSFVVAICDGLNYLMQSFVIGYSGVAQKDDDLDTYIGEHPADSSLPTVEIAASAISNFFGHYRVGTIKLTPAEIFAGNVAALNANFFSSNEDYSGMLGGSNKSIVEKLKGVVSAWYVAIRNIAIVGLLSVLLYLGIRIVISSSAGDKAKYKQTFMDWLIALCLIFFLHYIMAFTMTIADQVTSVLGGDENPDGTISQLVINITDGNNGNKTFGSNFINVARTKTQFGNVHGKVGYTIMYVAFTAYTVYFVIVYMKRLIMLAFYTLMAPAVALSYPLDKLKDGKAQAFNFWLKDYIFYAFLPALHMIIYTVFISSALSLAVNNMIYALVAMAFIVPAEKIVKKMFGIHGNTEERAGGFAGGAVAGSLMSSLRKLPKGGQKGPAPNRTKTQSRTRIADNPNSVSFMDTMNATIGQKPSDNGNSTKANAKNQNVMENTNGNKAIGNYGVNNPEENRDQNYSGILGGTYSDNKSVQTSAMDINGQPNMDYGMANSMSNNKADNLAANPKGNINIGSDNKKKESKARRIINNASTAIGRRYTIAGGAKGIASSLGKKAGKAAIKGIGMAAGATALGMAGLGIGMVGGDLGDAFKGLSVGAAAGGYIGGNIGNAVNDTIDGRNELGRFASEVKYGSVEASDNARSRRNYISDEGNRARILADHPDFKAEDVDRYAQRRYDMMYDSGVDDESMADKALKLEDSLIGQGLDAEQAHRSAYGALSAAQKYSFSDLADQSKREKYQSQVARRAMQEGGVSKENAERMAKNYFDNMAVIRGVTSAPKAISNNTSTQRNATGTKREGKRQIDISNAKTVEKTTKAQVRKINTEKIKRGPGRPRKN